MATTQFQALIGEQTLTRSKASVYAAYLDVSGTPIEEQYKTLHVWYSTDPEFGTHSEVTFQPTMASSSMVVWRNNFLEGLHSGTTYYWIAWCGNVPTVSTSANGNFETLDGITITNGSLSASEIKLGDSVSMSWSFIGNKGDTGSWNFCSTTTSTYKNPTKFKTVNQSSTSPQSWTPASKGTLYIWVWHYDGDAGETSNIYCLGQLKIVEKIESKSRIYNGSNWVVAVPYVYKDGAWKKVDAKVYSGGWK